MKKRVLAFAAGLIALVGYAGANAAGVCVVQGRILPNEEFFTTAVQRLAVGDFDKVALDGTTDTIRRPPTVQAFLDENPECCSIFTSPGSDRVRTPTVFDRIFDLRTKVVQVHVPEYRGESLSQPARTYLVPMTNCGNFSES